MFFTILLAISLAFNVLATGGTIYYVWKIIKLGVTPKRTWSLKLLASCIGMAQILWGSLYVNDILALISTYPPVTIVVSYSLAALRTGLIYAFVRNIYLSLVARFPLS